MTDSRKEEEDGSFLTGAVRVSPDCPALVGAFLKQRKGRTGRGKMSKKVKPPMQESIDRNQERAFVLLRESLLPPSRFFTPTFLLPSTVQSRISSLHVFLPVRLVCLAVSVS
mmetsp:Transcript_23794/g.46745  ORF Transcript_23794/g.46745 Transcript_23794/m.46745 type:complete len:112 (+) Transcript_23794:238-573(+)